MSDREEMEAVSQCYSCRQFLPLENFYFHPSGNPYKRCRQCNNRLGLIRRHKRMDEVRAKDRERYRLTVERQRALDRAWIKRNRPKMSAALRMYREHNPEANRAHDAVAKAVKRGQLKRPEACSRCGDTKSRIEAHHPDYSRPLRVEWLCGFCHRQADAERRAS